MFLKMQTFAFRESHKIFPKIYIMVQTSMQFDKSKWCMMIFFILTILWFFMRIRYLWWIIIKSLHRNLYNVPQQRSRKGCKIDGFLTKMNYRALTSLAWKTKSVSDCKILHFEKHGISINTFEKQAMFLEMQNFAFKERFGFSCGNI